MVFYRVRSELSAACLSRSEQYRWTLKYLAAVVLIGIIHVFDRMINADILTILMAVCFFTYSSILFCRDLYVCISAGNLRVSYRPMVIVVMLLLLFLLQPLAYFDYVNLVIFHWYYHGELMKADKSEEIFGWGGGWDPIYLVHFRDPQVAQQLFEVDGNWEQALFPDASHCPSGWFRRLTPTYYVTQIIC